MMKSEAIGPLALLCCGAVFNLSLIICLHRTWRYWNQTKWYIVMMTAGNCLEVLFTLTTLLGSAFHESWPGGDLSCKFLMFMNPLGPSVANMALTATAIHVLLTSITGCYGSRLRHVLVLGVFVVLSLPLPVSKIPIYSVVSDQTFDKVMNTCTDLGFFHLARPHQRFYYFVAGSIALVFFPLVIIVGAVGGAVMIVSMGSTADRPESDRRREDQPGRDNNTHGDNSENTKNTADVILMVILGSALMLLCVPLHIFIIFFGHLRTHEETLTVYMSLVYLFYSKVSLTACVCVIYACAHVYRKGRTAHALEKRAAGERTKLVN